MNTTEVIGVVLSIIIGYIGSWLLCAPTGDGDFVQPSCPSKEEVDYDDACEEARKEVESWTSSS